LPNRFRSSLEVNTDLRALPQVLDWLDQLNCEGVPSAVWLQCQLAIAEGFTNAVRHAHRDRALETPIRLEITVFPSYLEISIWDQGPPFDLARQLEHLPPSNSEAEGGRGLVLIQKIADALSYERTEDGYNQLRIRKAIASEPEL
jgi:serine/threonine-protein kinase RsbW